MSDGIHPDLDEFYDAIDEDGADWIDEDDDDEGEMYLDPEDIIAAIDDDDDDDEYIDEDEDEEDGDDYYEEGESDDDMGGAQLVSDPNAITVSFDDDEEDEEEDGSGQAFLQLAEVINNSSGSIDARTSLLARLLAGPGGRARSTALLRRLAPNTGLGAEERARQRQRDRWWKPQTEPNPNGVELLKGGEFGTVGQWRAKGKAGKFRPIPYDRRIRPCVTPSPKNTQGIVPNTPGVVVASYPSVPYVGQFGREDYSLFYSATQYFTLHLYNMNQSRKQARRARERAPSLPLASGPIIPEEEENEEDYVDEDDDEDDDTWGRGGRGIATEDTSLKKIKTVQGEEGSWTITDCDADRKGEKMIYSSITPWVHMLYTSEFDQQHVKLDFSGPSRRGEGMWGYDRFGIWSIRFSADGKEVVVGAGGGKIMVYDIDAQRRSLSVSGHADDVNAVCFADESSTNILVSGSDDGYVKVWDRRSLSSSTPSGILVGATEGITYTSPKGDGRYIVVNSKDQACRLYDLRKMKSHSEFEGEPDAVAKWGHHHFDYRNTRYPRPARLAHPKDCSVMTFRGHSVLRTLIRCHFSPRESTGQSYIYSGSADGLIHIWSLDGRVVQVLNRAETAPIRSPTGIYNDPSSPSIPRSGGRERFGAQAYESYGMGYTVRDVSWHGYEPTLMSTCWEIEGGMRRGGTIAKHEWKGLGKGGLKMLEDWVEKSIRENS